jgi:hypothetical protein
MAARTSSIRLDKIEYSLWLVFDEKGAVRMTRTMPSVGRGERAMQLTLIVPRSVFRTPQLKATIAIAEGAPIVQNIDIDAATEALRKSIGVDVDLRVVE